MQVHTPRPLPPSHPPPNAPPRLWPQLSFQQQLQLAGCLADLIRRIRSAGLTTEEVSHAKP